MAPFTLRAPPCQACLFDGHAGDHFDHLRIITNVIRTDPALQLCLLLVSESRQAIRVCTQDRTAGKGVRWEKGKAGPSCSVRQTQEPQAVPAMMWGLRAHLCRSRAVW